MRDLAQRILDGDGDPMWLAKEVFDAGFEHGGFAQPVSEPQCPDLADATYEFLELFEAIEVHQDNAEGKAAYDNLIRKAATAFLEGKPFLEWEDRGDPAPWRPSSR